MMNLCLLSAQVLGILSHTNLVKELLPCGVGVEGKLQLRVHGGDANVDLQQKEKLYLFFISFCFLLSFFTWYKSESNVSSVFHTVHNCAS